MADLYNLLDEIDNPQENLSEEDWDEAGREQLELPPALVEAERRKHTQQQPSTPDAADERVDLHDFLQPKEIFDLPYARLNLLWSQEHSSPELLPYDAETIETMIEAIKRQEERIDDMDSLTGNANIDALTASLMKVDMERVKFLICNMLKQRLHKIESYHLHLRDNVESMSDNEVTFLREYGSLFEGHLKRTVLNHVAQEAWKKLDEPEMIDKPDLETYVFIRTNEPVAIDNGTEEEPELQHHEEGVCLIVQYNKVRQLLLDNKAMLLM